MIKFIIILLFLFLIPRFGHATTPINHFSDFTEFNGVVTQSIYSYPKYFDDNGAFEEVNTNIVASQDVGWDWEVKNGVYKLRIKNDGTFEVNHLGDIFTLKLNGLGFYNQDTQQRVIPIQTQMIFLNPLVNGNTITWSLPGGTSYEIQYLNDTLKDILTIGTIAKNFLKNNKPVGWTVDNTWVMLIYDIDDKSTMIESNNLETENDVNFIFNGRVKHKIRQAFARSSNYQEPIFDSSGNVTNLIESSLEWKRRRIIRNGKYIEAIKATALDITDNGSLIFNTDVTFREGNSGYSGTNDTYMFGGSETTNNFNSTTLEVHCQFSSGLRSGLVKFDVSSIPSDATVSSATLSLYARTSYTNLSISVYRVFKPWVEETTDAVYWRDTDTMDWSNARSQCANDSGTDNSNDNGACNATNADRTVTEEANNALVNTGAYEDWTITTAVQNWVSGSWNNNGLFVYPTCCLCGNDGADFSSSENTTNTERPRLTVSYTSPTAMWRTNDSVWNDAYVF